MFKTNVFLSWALLSLFLGNMSSCSFSKSNDGDNTDPNLVNRRIDFDKPDPNSDSDGDGITDAQEETLGRNSLIADMPELKVRFLQNYRIDVKYHTLADNKIGGFVIDTKVHEDDADFKYRIGDIFLKNESYQNAANIGKFSTHNTGDIKEHDLSWVSYPEIDPRFFSKKQIEYKKYFDHSIYAIDSITVVLENSARLEVNQSFKNINNLALNFYYYDYQKDNYVQLKTAIIDKHFNAGVNETFDAIIENVPERLISDNYFKRGEFIISEVGDYEIPDLGNHYKDLLASVKAKTTPVIFNTPLESNIYYVATGDGGKNFASIMSAIFGNKVTIENNDLHKIGQFETNLTDFTYLKEVKDQDKKGKWFVFTNKINQHYLDYKFSPKDIISLSYVTGKELAEQSSEKFLMYKENAISDNVEQIYPLGNVSPNSVVDIELKTGRAYGELKFAWNDVFHSNGGSCGKNCWSPEFTCNMSFNLFSPIDSDFVFNFDKSYELELTSLMINQDEYSLKDLISSKKVIPTLVDGKNLHLKIADINAIKQLKETDENVLALKMKEFKETTFNGIKIDSWSGAQANECANITHNIALSKNWPISVESVDFGRWGANVNWSKVQRGDAKTYTRNYSLSISSIINNFYN